MGTSRMGVTLGRVKSLLAAAAGNVALTQGNITVTGRKTAWGLERQGGGAVSNEQGDCGNCE